MKVRGRAGRTAGGSLVVGAGLGAGAVAALARITRGAGSANGVPVAREPERGLSYWMATIPDPPRFPSLDRDITVDVAIVGGGFTGLATAYYLKREDPSLRVAVVESHRLGSGASSRNSGAVSPRVSGFEPDETAASGFRLLKGFAQTEGVDIDLEESVPALYLHRHPPRDATPAMSGETLRRAIGSPFYVGADAFQTNSVHPGKLIAGLIAANARLGVDLYEGSPVLEMRRDTRPLHLRTPRARIEARDVVLATNAYTPGLGIARDRIFALHHRVIVTRPLTPEEWETSGLERWPMRFEVVSYATHTVRTTPDRRFFFRHVLGHRLGEETAWAVTARDVRRGQTALLRRYPWLTGVPIEYEWHGVTSRTRDWKPITGQIDDHLYIAAGYNGSGVMPTHFFGYLVAQRLLGQDLPEFSLFRPPEQHPSIPDGVLRHAAVDAWFRYRRLRDG